MPNPFQQELKQFFLLFGAEHSLAETEVEKLERVLHELQPGDLEQVKKLSLKVVELGIEKPEDELVDLLKAI